MVDEVAITTYFWEYNPKNDGLSRILSGWYRSIMANAFSTTVKELIKKIPMGKVCTYGIIAASAGNPRAARQVARILHSCSGKDGLPWHRVVNRNAKISLKPNQGYEIQKQLLEAESVVFDPDGTIDFNTFLWMPGG
jgi:methylated-DNA-protein-cysteine methyltransferase related protein